MRHGIALAAVIIAAGAAPAAAFDCAKARTDVERAICASDAARQANDRMEAAYFALRDRLSESGRRLLLDGQKAWLRHRDASCGAEPGCLEETSRTRAEELEKTPAGMVAIMLHQAGSDDGYEVKISGYRFEAPAGPAETAYEQWVSALVADTPYGKPPEKSNEPHPPYSHEVAIDPPRLMRGLISAVAHSYDYSGGAHPNSWSTSINLDRASGRQPDTGELFGSSGALVLAEACARQIVEWYSDMYEDMSTDEALAELRRTYPQEIENHVGDMTRWHFDADGAVIRFDPYAVAPYAAGPAECRFGYGELRALALRPELLARE